MKGNEVDEETLKKAGRVRMIIWFFALIGVLAPLICYVIFER